MKLAIVEDEKIHQDYLVTMLEHGAVQEGIKLSLHIFKSAEQFLLEEDHTFDGVLLDIVLEEMNGFALAKHIRQVNEDMVIAFITGERNYVFDGYKVGACSYLLKPIKQEEITDLLKTLKDKVAILEPVMTLQTSQGLINLYQSKIKFIESNDHASLVYTKNEAHVSKNTMTMWASVLNEEYFFRPHRCYLINLRHVERIDKKNILIDGNLLPIARGKWKPLMEAYMNFKRRTY